jgi:hypothetical protein
MMQGSHTDIPLHNVLFCSCPSSSLITTSSSDAAAGDLELSIVWQGKRPTRLPEALWLLLIYAMCGMSPNYSKVNPVIFVASQILMQASHTDASLPFALFCSCPSSSSIPSSGSHAAAGDLEVSVVWQGKRPTRLPEALWLSFQPAPAAVDQASWRLHKLGSLISPMEVRF